MAKPKSIGFLGSITSHCLGKEPVDEKERRTDSRERGKLSLKALPPRLTRSACRILFHALLVGSLCSPNFFSALSRTLFTDYDLALTSLYSIII